MAQGAKAYKDRGGVRNQQDDKIVVKEEVTAEDEADALARLASAVGPHRQPLSDLLYCLGCCQCCQESRWIH